VNYRAFSAYKESGVPWLGQIPEHWSAWRFSHAVSVNGGQVDPRLAPWSEMTLIAPNHIESGTGRLSATETAAEQGADSGKYRIRKGQVIYSKIRPALRKATLAPADCLSSADMYGLHPVPGLMRDRFLLEVVLSKPFTDFVIDASMRVAMPKINREALGAGTVWFPSLEEQDAILAFLDRETAQIDELIAKQNALIELLGERLDRAWSAAVDELTKHFGTAPLRRAVSSVVDGPFGSALTSAHYSDEGAGVVRLGNIGINEFKLLDRAYIPLEYAFSLSAHAVRPGDVVVAGLGDEKMPLGRAAIVPGEFGPGIVKADCYRVRPASNVAPEYLAWILSSPQLRSQFRAISRGSTRQRLNTRVVQEVRIPIPTKDAQMSAVGRFSALREAHRALTHKAVQVVELLRERRSALITAAVTGKIDVRGEA